MMPELDRTTSKTGSRRARRSQADIIQGLTNHGIRRFARRGGIRRIKKSIYDTVREITEAKVREIVRNAVQYTTQAGRRAVTSLDIVFALNKTPGMTTNHSLPVFPAGWHPVSAPQQTGIAAVTDEQPEPEPEPEPETKDEVDAADVKTDESSEDDPIPEERVVKRVRFEEDEEDLGDEIIMESIETDDVVDTGMNIDLDMDTDTDSGYDGYDEFDYAGKDDIYDDDDDEDDDADDSAEEHIYRINKWRNEVAAAMDEEDAVKEEESD